MEDVGLRGDGQKDVKVVQSDAGPRAGGGGRLSAELFIPSYICDKHGYQHHNHHHHSEEGQGHLHVNLRSKKQIIKKKRA